MKGDLISIIIPTYNRDSLLGETLESILLQTYKNWECIVVDDSSTDYTLNLLKLYSEKDSRIHYFKRPLEKLKGANTCRNFGFYKSKGEYILWFDSDDIMNREFLEMGVEKLKSRRNLDFTFFNYQIFEEYPFKIVDNQFNKSIYPLFDYFSGKINFSTCGVIWKRKSINSGYNENLKKTQELDFIFNNYKNNRLLEGGYVDYNAYLLRKHDNSIVSSYKSGNPEFLLSDVYVRKEIMDYFNKQKYPQVWGHQKREYSKSLRQYFKKAKSSHILRYFFIQLSPGKLLLLLFYRIVERKTGRNHRLNKLLSDLSVKSYNFKMT